MNKIFYQDNQRVGFRLLKSIFLKFQLLFIGLLLIPCIILAAFNYDPNLKWKSLSTKHFQIHFHNGEEKLAQKTALIAEKAYSELTPYFSWYPKEKTNLVLYDRLDFSNGMATFFPRNTIYAFVTPPDEINQLVDYNDWLDLLIRHEYTHILHLDKAEDNPLKLRDYFGRLLVLFPNLFQPNWVHEGLAVYKETDRKQRFGRLEGPYFDMLMRIEVQKGIKPLSQVNQPVASLPGGITRYLYGAYFFDFLKETYGDQKIRNWIAAYSENLIPFRLNSTAESVFGKNMYHLWNEYIVFLTKRFREQLKKIKKSGIKSGIQLKGIDWAYSPKTANKDEIYWVKNDRMSSVKLMRYSTVSKTSVKIADVLGKRYDYHKDSGILISQVDTYRNLNQLADLYLISESGNFTKLTDGERYRYGIWSEDGKNIIAVKNELGNASLNLLDNKGKLIKKLWQGKNSEVISKPVILPKSKKIIASVWRENKRWNLEVFDLEKQNWSQLTDNKYTEGDPAVSTDGAFLVYTADYDGSFNLYKMELKKTDNKIKVGKLVKLSNINGGAFQPTIFPDNQSLVYQQINVAGYSLYKINLNNRNKEISLPVSKLTQAKVKKPIKLDYQAKVTDYSALDHIKPAFWVPYLEWNSDRNEIGFYTLHFDPLFRHNYSILGMYDLKNKWWRGSLDYLYDRWNPSVRLHYDRNYYFERDDKNDLERIKRKETIGVEAIFPLLSARRDLSLNIGLFRDRKEDFKIESGNASEAEKVDNLSGIALLYDSAKRYQMGISYLEGSQLKFVVENSDNSGSDYSGQVYQFEGKHYFQVQGKSVLAARFNLGWGTDKPREFNLGGNASQGVGNIVRSGAEQNPLANNGTFNQRDFPLRGYSEGLSNLTGRRMYLASIEYRLPIALIERGFMSPPVGVHQLYGTVFFDQGDAWNSEGGTGASRSVGVELNADTVLGYLLPVAFRFGLARGFDQNGETKAYLSTGNSF